MARLHLRTSTAVLVLAVASGLLVPVSTMPVLGSTSVDSAIGFAGPVEANLIATSRDLGTLGGNDSQAVAVDGSIVVGDSITASGGRRAFAYDLAASEPVMLDLGTLGGNDSQAVAVDGSIVVGRSVTASGEEHGFVYDLAAPEPVMQDLGSLGGDLTLAEDVDGGIVVGRSETASGGRHAFAYDLAAPEPVMQDLGTLGGVVSDAIAVDGSIVVGRSLTASRMQHAFAYDLAAAEPAMLDLGTLGGSYSSASDVDGAVVVGSSDVVEDSGSRAFAYDLAASEPAMRDLGTLGGRRAIAAEISGTIVVGNAQNTNDEWRAFAYDLAAAEPVMRDLGTLGGASIWASGIDGNVVVGEWEVPRQSGQPSRAFAYDLGAADPHFVDLGPSPFGPSNGLASDVDDGVVVGYSGRATAWRLGQTIRPMIAFRRVHHVVGEGVGRVTIQLTRYGRTDRAVTVRYRTRSFTAKAGQEFVATSGTLRFARGVTRGRFKVKILEDRRRESNEYLRLTLSRPSSPAMLGTPKWSHLRIQDNDR